MPSPFPGMDPYLEGYLWPDVHHALAEEIRRQLTPKIAPQYVARIAIRFVAEELASEETVGIMLPDVEVISSSRTSTAIAPAVAAYGEVIATAPFVLPLKQSIRTRLASVEIRDTASRTLVTSIEILSPVNKRGSGWDEYQQKRQTVMRSSAHLLEIDLLRPGRRPVHVGRLPAAPYFAFLTRAPLRQIEVWPAQLADKLPILPLPLQEPDPDVPLDLSAALAAVYDSARYDLDIDYHRPPEPPLTAAESTWATTLFDAR
jgi:hypothetical protein